MIESPLDGEIVVQSAVTCSGCHTQRLTFTHDYLFRIHDREDWAPNRKAVESYLELQGWRVFHWLAVP